MVNRKKQKENPTDHGIMNFTSWKQEVMDRIISDPEICKLLKYPTPDALACEELTEDERYDLIDNQVFGFRFVPEPVNKQKSFISLGLSNFVPQEGYRQFSNEYIMGYLYIYILVDNSIFRTDTGYRQDLILARIYDIFQGARGFGMGEIRLESSVELWQHNNQFGGYSSGFSIVEKR